jgi:hypothetical protein
MRFLNPIPTKKWLVGLAAAGLFACQEPSREVVTPQEECFSTRVVQELTRVDGQVEKVANFYVIQTGEQRYSTCGLPPKLRVAGTQIQFDAKVYEIPPNVRLGATPIRITRIY